MREESNFQDQGMNPRYPRRMFKRLISLSKRKKKSMRARVIDALFDPILDTGDPVQGSQ